MTYDEFLDKLRGNNIVFSKQYSGRYGLFVSIYDDELNEDSCVSYKWVTGGVTGGSCWGTERTSRETEDEPTEFESLNEVLAAICPNITFLQAQKILSLKSKSYYTDRSDYYGNEIEYTIKYINLKELYEKLIEIGLLEAEED